MGSWGNFELFYIGIVLGTFDVTKCHQQIEIPDLLHMCAPCSELASNISTIIILNFDPYKHLNCIQILIPLKRQKANTEIFHMSLLNSKLLLLENCPCFFFFRNSTFTWKRKSYHIIFKNHIFYRANHIWNALYSPSLWKRPGAEFKSSTARVRWPFLV